MVNRTKVTSIELTQPLQTISDLEGYQQLQGLLRWRGVPLGYVFLPVKQGQCSAEAIISAAIAHYTEAIARELLSQSWQPERVASGSLQQWVEAAIAAGPPDDGTDLPTVSVVVCPQSQTEDNLLQCLQSLERSARLPLEVIVAVESVADWPTANTTYAWARWLTVPEASRSVQRNLAVQAAQGDVVAFVDDTCRVDAHWVRAIAVAFAHYPEVGAIAGLVIPADIVNDEARLFEQRYSLDRGTRRLWHVLDTTKPLPWTGLATMWHVSGANLAVRKSLLQQLDGFDPALDQVGTTWTGADLDLLARVLVSGQLLMYEPSAIVQHELPNTVAALQARVQREAIGLLSYLAAGCQKYPTLRRQFVTVGIWKLYHLLADLVRWPGLARQMAWAELVALGQGWGAYAQAQRFTGQLPMTSLPQGQPPLLQAFLPVPPKTPQKKFMAVRTVDLGRPLTALEEVADYEQVRVFVTDQGRPLGHIDIANAHRNISAARLQQEIATHLTGAMLAIAHGQDADDARTRLQIVLKEVLLPPAEEAPTPQLPPLADSVAVSIVITTCDRPDDLQTCLEHLLALETRRPVEILVADNRPASGLTPQVLTRFPTVKLVSEARPGAAYGRNAAIAASTGDIIVTIDDDVTVPPDWLEKLIAPMVRSEVMVVTGNVLPKELETPAQFLFEKLKGGLSQGYQPFEANGDWLAATQRGLPPIWDLGVSANAAFRASMFCHPQIGLMDETLGPGTPTAGGEECYLLYRVLRAGFTVVYEPTAYAWHRHRREMQALYHQVYSHMKGGMAFMMRVWLVEGDRRAFRHLFFQMPGYLKQRLIDWALKRHEAPLPFVWQEVRGYLDTFWSYRASCRRVKSQGRSLPYVPPADRLSQPLLNEDGSISHLAEAQAIADLSTPTTVGG